MTTTIQPGTTVIVRGRGSGVLFGTYLGHEGSSVHLADAIQMWRWHAAKGGTLIDCATHGVLPNNCRFSPGRATVTVTDACAIIHVTPEAAQTIISVGW
jgi:hypothetical protein